MADRSGTQSGSMHRTPFFAQQHDYTLNALLCELSHSLSLRNEVLL